MENYREYLENKIAEAIELNMPITRDAYQDSLDTYMSFQDADTLKSTQVAAVGRRSGIGRGSQFAELFGTFENRYFLTVGSNVMHNNVDNAIFDSLKYEKERGITINETLLEDKSFKITALPRMITEPLIPLDKYGKPLLLPGSKFHK